MAQLDGVEAPATGGLPFASSQVYRGRVDGALPWLTHRSVSERDAGRELLCYLARAGCCVGGHVVFEQDHTVGDVEVVSDPPDDYDCRDVQRSVQGTHQVYKRRDGLAPHQLAHPLVPDHEVRRARVLVHEQERRPYLDGLGDVRSLRGRTRGVQGGEFLCAPAAGELPDHGRDVHPGDAPAVLGPDLYSISPRHNQLSAVTWHVVVNAPRERREQRALPVEPAPGHERHALRNPHPRNEAPIRQFHLHPVLLRAPKRYGTIP